MTAIQQLITEHMDIWTAADTAKRSGRGRASGNAGSVYGVKKLRELILELAVCGKLVPQDGNDEPASELLKRIQAEKTKLVAEGKIKKDKTLAPIGEHDKPFELPQGWEWVKLGVITQKLTDGSHNPPSDAGSGLPMLSSQNVNLGKIDFNSPSRFVTEEDFIIENSRTKIEANDVLLTIVGSLGRSAVVPANAPKFVLQRSVAVIKTEIFSEFLCLQLSSPYCANYFDFHGKGTAQKGIYLGQLSEMPTVVPSIAEQHRIVAKVDELMALCDQLEAQHSNAAEAHEKLVSHLLGMLTQAQTADDFSANWQRISAHFDTLFTTEASIDALKQTLLQLAVMGKLVPQDAFEEPTSELLKRIQAEKAKLVAEGKIKKDKPLAAIDEDEKPFELPLGWEWAKVLDCSVFVTDGEHLTPQRTSDGLVPLVTAKNVRDGYMDYEDTDFVDVSVAEKCWKRCKPEQGDLLMVSVGATLGRLTILHEPKEMVIVRSVTLIRPCLLSPLYLSVAIKSPLVQQAIWGSVRQMAQPGLYLAQSSNLIIPLPPLVEQHRIVAKVDELMTLCDQLKTRMTAGNQQQLQLAEVLVAQALEA